jgi:hypothetical protein
MCGFRRPVARRTSRLDLDQLGRVGGEAVTRLLVAIKRRITPEPVIGPRIAQTRWAPIRPCNSDLGPAGHDDQFGAGPADAYGAVMSANPVSNDVSRSAPAPAN